MKPAVRMASAPAVAPLRPALTRSPGSRQFKPGGGFSPVGVAAIGAAHGLLGYALVSSMAGKAVQTFKKPLDATIIAELAPPPLTTLPLVPPPQTPLPKISKIGRAPKPAPPPRAYASLLGAGPAVVTAPAIDAAQLAPLLPAASARADMAMVCPGQIKPDVPRKSIENGVEDT